MSKHGKQTGEAKNEVKHSTSGIHRQLPDPSLAERESSSLNKMADKSQPTKGSQGYGQFFLEYSLMAEYNHLQKEKLPGVYVIPSSKSTFLWNGILFIRQGMYQEGAFRFSLVIPENYPDACPRLIFDPPVFHPIIDPSSGELDVKRGFQRWRKNVNKISQVLLYARKIFYKIDTKNPLNAEAATLYEQQCDVFKSKVTECIRTCKEKLYEEPAGDDTHSIRFSRWDETVHSKEKQKMLTSKVKKEPS